MELGASHKEQLQMAKDELATTLAQAEMKTQVALDAARQDDRMAAAVETHASEVAAAQAEIASLKESVLAAEQQVAVANDERSQANAVQPASQDVSVEAIFKSAEESNAVLVQPI